jgi:hypothetical protein
MSTVVLLEVHTDQSRYRSSSLKEVKLAGLGSIRHRARSNYFPSLASSCLESQISNLISCQKPNEHELGLMIHEFSTPDLIFTLSSLKGIF